MDDPDDDNEYKNTSKILTKTIATLVALGVVGIVAYSCTRNKDSNDSSNSSLNKSVDKSEPLSKEDIARLEEEERLTAETVKYCPLCNKATFKIPGCNYMKCSNAGKGVSETNGEPTSDCLCEWCWECTRNKYKPIPGKEYMGFCDDKGHNSH